MGDCATAGLCLGEVFEGSIVASSDAILMVLAEVVPD